MSLHFSYTILVSSFFSLIVPTTTSRILLHFRCIFLFSHVSHLIETRWSIISWLHFSYTFLVCSHFLPISLQIKLRWSIILCRCITPTLFLYLHILSLILTNTTYIIDFIIPLHFSHTFLEPSYSLALILSNTTEMIH